MTWQNNTLGEICKLSKGFVRTGPFGTQLHQSEYAEEGTPVIMPKDIIDGKVSVESIARVEDDVIERLSQHKLRTGDIVYGRRGDIGRRALVTERENNWLCGTGCIRVNLGEGVIDPFYLYYYLGQSQIIDWMKNQAIGATMPNLNASIIERIPVSYPPQSSQRRIADILFAYDALIENNTHRIHILDQMAQSIYFEWFGKVEIKSLPKGWKLVAINDISKLQRGKSYRSENLVEEGLPFLNLKCFVRDGGFRYDGIKRFQGDYKEQQTARKGDIIMAVTDMTQDRRIVARAARVPDINEEFFVMSMDVVKLVPNQDVDKTYLYAMLQLSEFGDEVKQHANGVNVLHLSPERIEQYKFPLPPASFRDKYGEIVKPIYELCDTLEKKNANLRRTRDLLLPRLVSGELDISDVKLAGQEM